MPRLSLLSVLFWFLLPACIFVATAPDETRPQTAQAVHDKTRVEYDHYKNSTWVNGPTINASSLTAFHLRSLWIGGSQKSLQLYVSDKSSSWRHFAHANDSDGNSLPLTPIGTDVDSFSYGRIHNTWCYEDVAVELTKEYLESHASSGMSVKVWGNAGERIVDVPPFYIEGFLRCLGDGTTTPVPRMPIENTPDLAEAEEAL